MKEKTKTPIREIINVVFWSIILCGVLWRSGGWVHIIGQNFGMFDVFIWGLMAFATLYSYHCLTQSKK